MNLKGNVAAVDCINAHQHESLVACQDHHVSVFQLCCACCCALVPLYSCDYTACAASVMKSHSAQLLLSQCNVAVQYLHRTVFASALCCRLRTANKTELLCLLAFPPVHLCRQRRWAKCIFLDFMGISADSFVVLPCISVDKEVLYLP